MTAKPANLPKYRRLNSQDRRAMLIDAGIACLARGGILGFTIDTICREAQVSRGLITHHFRSKDGLLAAIYSQMYSRSLAIFDQGPGKVPEIGDLIAAEFHSDVFNSESITIWLALWGEIATNPELGKEHRKNYQHYRSSVAALLTRTASARGRQIDADQLAIMLIALIDGLWIEYRMAPDLLSGQSAADACHRLLEPYLGVLPRG